MPLSELIQKPRKRDGTLAWKGSPEMKESADEDTWPDWLKFLDSLEEHTALDLMLFFHDWYLKCGYSNLGKMVISGVNAAAAQRASENTKEPV